MHRKFAYGDPRVLLRSAIRGNEPERVVRIRTNDIFLLVVGRPTSYIIYEFVYDNMVCFRMWNMKFAYSIRFRLFIQIWNCDITNGLMYRFVFVETIGFHAYINRRVYINLRVGWFMLLKFLNTFQYEQIFMGKTF